MEKRKKLKQHRQKLLKSLRKSIWWTLGAVVLTSISWAIFLLVFADAADSVIPTILAIFALTATVIGMYFQYLRNHNSVRPVVDFQCYCSTNILSVSLRNAGTGPMLVKSLTVLLDGCEANSVTSCFDKDDLDYLKMFYIHDYAHIREGGRSFTPGEKLTLMSLQLHDDLKKKDSLAGRIAKDKLTNFDYYADSDAHASQAPFFAVTFLRTTNTFRKIRIIVDYENVYGAKFRDEIKLSGRFGEDWYLFDRYFKGYSPDEKQQVLVQCS